MSIYAFGTGLAGGYINKKRREQDEEAVTARDAQQHKNALELVDRRAVGDARVASNKKLALRTDATNFFLTQTGVGQILDDDQQVEVGNLISLMDDDSVRQFTARGLEGTLDIKSFRERLNIEDPSSATITLPVLRDEKDPDDLKIKVGQQNIVSDHMAQYFGIDEKFVVKSLDGGSRFSIPSTDNTGAIELSRTATNFQTLTNTIMKENDLGAQLGMAHARVFFPNRVNALETDAEFKARKRLLREGRIDYMLNRVVNGASPVAASDLEPGEETAGITTPLPPALPEEKQSREERIIRERITTDARDVERENATTEVAKQILQDLYSGAGEFASAAGDVALEAIGGLSAHRGPAGPPSVDDIVDFGGVAGLPSARDIVSQPISDTIKQVGDRAQEGATRVVDMLRIAIDFLREDEQKAEDYIKSLPPHEQDEVIEALQSMGE